MSRTSIAVVLVTVLAAGSLEAIAASEFAVIKSRDIDPYNQALSGFTAACAGDVDEYNLEGKRSSHDEIIEDITGKRPNLVVAIGSLAARVAKERLGSVPVLYVMVPNPRKDGLTGTNIAGVSLEIPIEKQLRTYKSMLPDLATVGVIYDPEKTGEVVRKADEVAQQLGMRIFGVGVSSQKEVPAALRRMIGNVDALWMAPDDTVVTPESFQYLLVTTFENSLPFLAASHIFVEVGALASLTPDYKDLGRQSCEIAGALQAGRLTMADINVVPPEKANLYVNLKTARRIGVTIPNAIIEAATAVYE